MCCSVELLQWRGEQGTICQENQYLHKTTGLKVDAPEELCVKLREVPTRYHHRRVPRAWETVSRKLSGNDWPLRECCCPSSHQKKRIECVWSSSHRRHRGKLQESARLYRGALGQKSFQQKADRVKNHWLTFLTVTSFRNCSFKLRCKRKTSGNEREGPWEKEI